MNKGELINVIAEKTDVIKNVIKKETDVVLSAALETIVDVIVSGEKVALVGFGSFEKRERSQREGRTLKIGEMMTIAATSVPGLSAGKLFKEKGAGAKQ